jgi:hypothetical protein
MLWFDCCFVLESLQNPNAEYKIMVIQCWNACDKGCDSREKPRYGIVKSKYANEPETRLSKTKPGEKSVHEKTRKIEKDQIKLVLPALRAD